MSYDKLTIDTIPSIPKSMNIITNRGNYNLTAPGQEQQRIVIVIDGMVFSFTLGLDEYDSLYITDGAAWWDQIRSACGLYAKQWVIPNTGPLLAGALAVWAEEAYQEATEEHAERLEQIERLQMAKELDDVERYVRSKLGRRTDELVERLLAPVPASAHAANGGAR